MRRKVKAKPFNASFSKQLALYTGPAFINKKALLAKLDATSLNFGRAKEVLLSQLRDPVFDRLFIEGKDTYD